MIDLFQWLICLGLVVFGIYGVRLVRDILGTATARRHLLTREFEKRRAARRY